MDDQNQNKEDEREGEGEREGEEAEEEEGDVREPPTSVASTLMDCVRENQSFAAEASREWNEQLLRDVMNMGVNAHTHKRRRYEDEDESSSGDDSLDLEVDENGKILPDDYHNRTEAQEEERDADYDEDEYEGEPRVESEPTRKSKRQRTEVLRPNSVTGEEDEYSQSQSDEDEQDRMDRLREENADEATPNATYASARSVAKETLDEDLAMSHSFLEEQFTSAPPPPNVFEMRSVPLVHSLGDDFTRNQCISRINILRRYAKKCRQTASMKRMTLQKMIVCYAPVELPCIGFTLGPREMVIWFELGADFVFRVKQDRHAPPSLNDADTFTSISGLYATTGRIAMGSCWNNTYLRMASPVTKPMFWQSPGTLDIPLRKAEMPAEDERDVYFQDWLGIPRSIKHIRKQPDEVLEDFMETCSMGMLRTACSFIEDAFILCTITCYRRGLKSDARQRMILHCLKEQVEIWTKKYREHTTRTPNERQLRAIYKWTHTAIAWASAIAHSYPKDHFETIERNLAVESSEIQRKATFAKRKRNIDQDAYRLERVNLMRRKRCDRDQATPMPDLERDRPPEFPKWARNRGHVHYRSYAAHMQQKSGINVVQTAPDMIRSSNYKKDKHLNQLIENEREERVRARLHREIASQLDKERKRVAVKYSSSATQLNLIYDTLFEIRALLRKKFNLVQADPVISVKLDVVISTALTLHKDINKEIEDLCKQ